ncbi:MAG: transglycosylase domain-containing protein [Nitrospinales bacterium]
MIKGFFEKVGLFLFTVFLAFLFLLIGIYIWVKQDLPQLPDSLEKINLSLPTEIYSSDGERIKVLGERRPVKLNEISPFFLKAIISVEDHRFYTHSGLDHRALLRAFYENLKRRKIVQGGSTITQQLSKNLFFTFERTWTRKVKELLIALQMEATFTKEEILEAYSNQIFYGNRAYGVEEATQTYFGKSAKDLTPLQAAMLAGLPNAPNNANPYRSYERSMLRTKGVLRRMVEKGNLAKAEMNRILDTNLELITPKIESNTNLYFVDYVIDKLEENYDREFIHFGGLKIFTTLDTKYQKLAHKTTEVHLSSLDKTMKPGKSGEPLQLQASLVTIENKTGAVRALLGGRQYSLSQFNRAVSSNRLPGSSFKPFVYHTAMETLGYSPATVLVDEPITIDIPGTKPWQPKNFNDKHIGKIVLKKALMKSLNVISAKLMQKVTPHKVIETARLFGVTSPLGKHLSLALGTSGVSPLEMATAYSVIANLGVLNEPYLIQKIEDFHGNLLYEHFYHGIQRLTQKSVFPLLDMMQGVVDNGTGKVVRRLGFNHPAGGKTGTTNDFKDAWFDGFTKDLTTTVWVGYDNNDPMINKSGKGMTGSSAAAPLWTLYMKKLLEGKDQVKFPVPEGIKFVTIDSQTGYLAEPKSKNKIRVGIKDEIEITPPPPPVEIIIPPENNLDDSLPKL